MKIMKESVLRWLPVLHTLISALFVNKLGGYAGELMVIDFRTLPDDHASEVRDMN